MDAISAVTPDHATFDLDFNGFLLDAGLAQHVLAELEALPKIHMFETPIPQRDVAGNATLRASSRRAIALHFHEPDFLTAMRESVCDGFAGHGEGLAATLHYAALAHETNMPFFVQLVGTGITTAFAAHLAAALPAARWPAVTALNIYADDLLREPLEIRRGYVRVPDAPGLGIEINAQALENFRRDATGPKPLPRGDLLGPLAQRPHRRIRVGPRLRTRLHVGQPATVRARRHPHHARGRRQRRLQSALSRHRVHGRPTDELEG